MNFSDSMTGLAADIAQLAKATGGFGWDRDPDAFLCNPADLGAKPIPRNEWLRAMRVAVDLTRAHPHLGRPTPGADPEGFAWLTWTLGDRRFALEIRRDGYAWERRDDAGNVHRHTSGRLEDVSEAMRAALPKAACFAA